MHLSSRVSTPGLTLSCPKLCAEARLHGCALPRHLKLRLKTWTQFIVYFCFRTGSFGPLKKVKIALVMPVFIGTVLGAWTLYKVIRIKCHKRSTDEHKQSAMSQHWRTLASVSTTLFTALAIFFVKSFLRAFDCLSSDLEPDHKFMASAPDVACDDSDPEYENIRTFSIFGLVMYTITYMGMWGALIQAHRSDNPGLGIFSFLADKYEDTYYYWCVLRVTCTTNPFTVLPVFSNRNVSLMLGRW